MKKTLLINLLALICFTGCAQKETYDVISFRLPKNWQKEIHENGLQLSAVNKQTGAYLAVVVTKSASSDLSASNNFINHWTKLVKGTVSVTEEPAMLAPVKDKDWDIISGQAPYTDGANKGTVTQITATGYGRVISLVAMTNTEKFRNELEQFLHSIALTELPKTQAEPSKTQTAETPVSSANSSSSTSSQPVSSPLAGRIWEGSSNEKSLGNTGFNSGGFFTYQYRFNTDGTYRFVNVNASSYTDTKSLKYESGTYLVNGNQLTIIPAKGYNEEWSKTGKISNGNSDVSNRAINDTWGKKLKSTPRKLEKFTYTFSIEYWEGNKANVLRLHHVQNTEREGSPGQNNTTNFFETIKEKTVRLPDTIL